MLTVTGLQCTDFDQRCPCPPEVLYDALLAPNILLYQSSNLSTTLLLLSPSNHNSEGSLSPLLSILYPTSPPLPPCLKRCDGTVYYYCSPLLAGTALAYRIPFKDVVKQLTQFYSNN